VTNNIADAYQEANTALDDNRRELAEESAKINSNPDLSDEARERYIDEAKAKAQQKYVSIIDQHEKDVADTLERNEKRLFQLAYPRDTVTDSQKENVPCKLQAGCLPATGRSRGDRLAHDVAGA
jgi:vacuolar-type H+-ATPase subunit H